MLNVLILGIGQCGNRILDSINKEAFTGKSKYFSKQKFPSHVETIAINSAINDLKELRHTLAKDRLHVPNLHGVGANRYIGKEGFNSNKDMIMESIESRGDFDIIFCITSAAGGTGSSFTPLIMKELKERYDVPVISLVVLPFREEGSIFLQNTAFCIREIIEVNTDGMLLIDNQYLKKYGGDIHSAYDNINRMTAERLLFLIEALDSEMLSVTDLGDLKTVMSGGLSIGTIGFYEADKNTSIKTAIHNSFKPSGLLFPAKVYEEGARAMIIISGDKKYLDVDAITKEIEMLSAEVGQVFKGIIIRPGRPKILSLFSLEAIPELENLYSMAADAINFEKAKRERSKDQLNSAFSHIDELEQSY